MEVHVTVTGWSEESIEEQVVGQAVSQIVEATKDRIESAIRDRVDEVATELIRERLAAEIDRILVEGWKEKGSAYYDAPKVVTLREKIEESLKPHDGYNGRANKLPEIVTAELRTRFDKEVKAGVERLKAKIDECINSTIEETITGDIRSKLRGVLARV